MCYPRKLEKQYKISRYIAEFWNTISNSPFIIIGILRLIEGTYFDYEYKLMICAGICSGFHHATTYKYTIIVDWIPILFSIVNMYQESLYLYISYATYFQMCLALFVLITDHVYTYIPVPWGHVFWHVLASFAVDSAYQSAELNTMLIPTN